jgi:hypothetical protein
MLGLSVGNVAGLTSVGELLLDLDVCALMQDCGEEEHRAEGRFPMALKTKKKKKKITTEDKPAKAAKRHATGMPQRGWHQA